ncbi:hypothetical protein CSB08_00315 [Candidatus Gracilibacteria bacterium]|nr:MAG: hypothetical protein CSB08_00315 [Candidatus Gracilibacteria bacterium]PIE85286.1 MAG: hypothetical protein CSA08_02665 [Candidatus Gracilibacteria bacterium]
MESLSEFQGVNNQIEGQEDIIKTVTNHSKNECQDIVNGKVGQVVDEIMDAFEEFDAEKVREKGFYDSIRDSIVNYLRSTNDGIDEIKNKVSELMSDISEEYLRSFINQSLNELK